MMIQKSTEAPEIKKGTGFWQNNRDTIISIGIVVIMMIAMKYLFTIALHSKLS